MDKIMLELFTKEQKEVIRNKLVAKVVKEVDNMKVKDIIDMDYLSDQVNDACCNRAGDIADVVTKYLVKKIKNDLNVK